MLNQQCSIGEAMIHFKGCFGFKQYMRDMPIKWVIKVWVLAGATNGYVKKFECIHKHRKGDCEYCGAMLQGCFELDGRTLHCIMITSIQLLCCSITCIIVKYMHMEQLAHIEST